MKTNNSLSIKVLTAKYDVEACGTAKFAVAIGNGELMNLIQTCADESYNGDIQVVVKQLLKNTANHRCVRKVTTSASKNIADMVDMFDEYLHTLRGAKANGGKSQRKFYEISLDEVREMSLVDARKVKACYASYVSKQLSGLATSQYTAEQAAIVDNYRLVQDICTAKAKEAKASEVKVVEKVVEVEVAKPVEASDDLKAKLEKALAAGKTTNLSKDQVAELAKLLGIC